MNSKTSSIICLAFLYVTITTCSGLEFSIDSNGVVTADAECSGAEDKEKCTLELCKAQNPNAFECRALDCKLKFLSNKRNILRCVKRVCKTDGHSICQGIDNCEVIRESDAQLGESKYIICVTKLFPKN